jgi:hypothetical protein
VVVSSAFAGTEGSDIATTGKKMLRWRVLPLAIVTNAVTLYVVPACPLENHMTIL